MSLLSDAQRRRALEVMNEYLTAPPNPDGRTPFEVQATRDKERVKLIEGELGPLVESFLGGRIAFEDFKSKVDGINKRNEYWGFKGIKGQMFFNMVVNVAPELAECEQELRAAIAIPGSNEISRSRIRTFQSYVRRIGDDFVEAGGSKHGRPKVGSIPFFLSYFWQIQDWRIWPVYYTNSVNTMIDLNLWQPTEDLADDYVAFKDIHEELAALFTRESGKSFDLYGVEHVFWFKGGNPYGEAKPLRTEDEDVEIRPADSAIELAPSVNRLPDSYVPPVVGILPQIARHDAGLEQAAKASGTTLARAFEKSIHAAFTILGYDTKLLGQGAGRAPDGLALDQDNSYAVMWDGKIRGDGYNMGTDDRTIREYVMTQSRELKRRRSFRNIYYLVVSSYFQDGFDDLIRSIKMETDTNEVGLLEANGLVAMVDAKLRNPLSVTLGPDGLQRLFSDSGIITAEDVVQILG